MAALIWTADHQNEAVAYTINKDGEAGGSVFDVQLSAGRLTIYDYLDGQPFSTDHLKTVDEAKAFCEQRFQGWLDRMGLVAIAQQDQDDVMDAVSSAAWRSPEQVLQSIGAGEGGLPLARVQRAVDALTAEGRLEARTTILSGKLATVYRAAQA